MLLELMTYVFDIASVIYVGLGKFYQLKPLYGMNRQDILDKGMEQMSYCDMTCYNVQLY